MTCFQTCFITRAPSDIAATGLRRVLACAALKVGTNSESSTSEPCSHQIPDPEQPVFDRSSGARFSDSDTWASVADADADTQPTTKSVADSSSVYVACAPDHVAAHQVSSSLELSLHRTCT